MIEEMFVHAARRLHRLVYRTAVWIHYVKMGRRCESCRHWSGYSMRGDHGVCDKNANVRVFSESPFKVLTPSHHLCDLHEFRSELSAWVFLDEPDVDYLAGVLVGLAALVMFGAAVWIARIC